MGGREGGPSEAGLCEALVSVVKERCGRHNLAQTNPQKHPLIILIAVLSIYVKSTILHMFVRFNILG